MESVDTKFDRFFFVLFCAVPVQNKPNSCQYGSIRFNSCQRIPLFSSVYSVIKQLEPSSSHQTFILPVVKLWSLHDEHNVGFLYDTCQPWNVCHTPQTYTNFGEANKSTLDSFFWKKNYLTLVIWAKSEIHSPKNNIIRNPKFLFFTQRGSQHKRDFEVQWEGGSRRVFEQYSDIDENYVKWAAQSIAFLSFFKFLGECISVFIQNRTFFLFKKKLSIAHCECRVILAQVHFSTLEN